MCLDLKLDIGKGVKKLDEHLCLTNRQVFGMTLFGLFKKSFSPKIFFLLVDKT